MERYVRDIFTRDVVSSVQDAFPHDWKYKGKVTLKSPYLPGCRAHADGALVGHDCLIELKSLGVGQVSGFEAPRNTGGRTLTL